MIQDITKKTVDHGGRTEVRRYNDNTITFRRFSNGDQKAWVYEKYDIKKKDPAWLPGDGACNDRRLPSGYLRQQRPLLLMCGWQ